MTIDKEMTTQQKLFAALEEIHEIRKLASERQVTIDGMASDARRKARYTAALERLASNCPDQIDFREAAREAGERVLAWHKPTEAWAIVRWRPDTKSWVGIGHYAEAQDAELSDFRPLPGRGTGRG